MQSSPCSKPGTTFGLEIERFKWMQKWISIWSRSGLSMTNCETIKASEAVQWSAPNLEPPQESCSEALPDFWSSCNNNMQAISCNCNTQAKGTWDRLKLSRQLDNVYLLVLAQVESVISPFSAGTQCSAWATQSIVAQDCYFSIWKSQDFDSTWKCSTCYKAESQDADLNPSEEMGWIGGEGRNMTAHPSSGLGFISLNWL